MIKPYLLSVCLGLVLASCGKAKTPSASALMFGGVQDGNGGDPRILQFAKARIDAANWVGKASLSPDLVTASPNAGVKAVMANADYLVALAQDILASPHQFPQGSHSPASQFDRCAWTNDLAQGSLDTITFDLDICSQGLANNSALFANLTLIHESLHHMVRKTGTPVFASTDDLEEFCNQGALAVAAAFDAIVQQGKPYWQDMAVDGSPSARSRHVAAWTGRPGSVDPAGRMYIFGGCSASALSINGCGQYYADGGAYDPTSDTWKALPTVGAPSPRADHVAVWTGAGGGGDAGRLVVFGGCSDGTSCATYLADGGIFDVATQTWTATSAATIGLKGRTAHSAVWTGAEMIVWGGEIGHNAAAATETPLNDGGRLRVGTGVWSPMAAPAADILSARRNHTAIWTGDVPDPKSARKMIVWGGCDREIVWFCQTYFGDGAMYDPATDTWTKISSTGAPSARRGHTTVWTGKYMLVWGGEGADGVTQKTGGAYDPATDTWFRINSLGPSARSGQVAVWTGDAMIVFGGATSPGVLATDTSLLTPPAVFAAHDSGTWSPVAIEFDPIKVLGHTAIWTGDQMIVWGGQSGPDAFADTGAIFHPGTPPSN